MIRGGKPASNKPSRNAYTKPLAIESRGRKNRHLDSIPCGICGKSMVPCGMEVHLHGRDEICVDCYIHGKIITYMASPHPWYFETRSHL